MLIKISPATHPVWVVPKTKEYEMRLHGCGPIIKVPASMFPICFEVGKNFMVKREELENDDK